MPQLLLNSVCWLFVLGPGSSQWHVAMTRGFSALNHMQQNDNVVMNNDGNEGYELALCGLRFFGWGCMFSLHNWST
jgi:hypothetical protein